MVALYLLPLVRAVRTVPPRDGAVVVGVRLYATEREASLRWQRELRGDLLAGANRADLYKVLFGNAASTIGRPGREAFSKHGEALERGKRDSAC